MLAYVLDDIIRAQLKLTNTKEFLDEHKQLYFLPKYRDDLVWFNDREIQYKDVPCDIITDIQMCCIIPSMYNVSIISLKDDVYYHCVFNDGIRIDYKSCETVVDLWKNLTYHERSHLIQSVKDKKLVRRLIAIPSDVYTRVNGHLASKRI